MKKNNENIERYRVKTGGFGSDESYGNNGLFLIKRNKKKLKIIASDKLGWDHISVTVSNLPRKMPTWNDMNFVKELFFEDYETVVQYHPKKEDYVNTHPWCLHLWRPQEMLIPLPPIELV